MISVLAFDPGVTTGFARILVKDDIATLHHIGEIPGWSGIDRMIQADIPQVIVYEEFRALSLNVITTSLEVIGVIKYLACIHNIPLICQVPSQRKFIIRRHPNIMDGYNSHHGDALMHALTFAYFQCNARRFIINKKDPEIFIGDLSV